ncbi:MAG: helix-turn-helix domain-containing protein [Clostridium sp.]|jgi:transcriptional regulator with XRE-family HTH domain|nr:MAG TPA: hypothetical protein [Caudoviricetes sp.]
MDTRIKELRTALGLSQQKFADKIGIARGNIAAYEVGKNKPSDAVISLICKEFNVNEDWLRNGIGDMFKQRDGSFSEMLSELDDSDDDFIKSFVAVYMELDEDSKEVLRKTARKMAEKRKKPD